MTISTILLKVNFGSNVPPTVGWDSAAPNSVGTTIAQLTDYTNGTLCDIALINETNAWTATSNGALTDSEHWGVESSVWNNHIHLPIATSNTLRYRGADLVVGRSYFLSFAGAVIQARPTSVNVNGATGTYNNTVQTNPITPAKPIQVLCTATDAGGGMAELIVVHSGTVTNKLVQFHLITDGIGLVNDDDTVQLGQSNTWGVAGFVPTAATIGGIPATAVSSSSVTFGDLVGGQVVPDYGLQTLMATNVGLGEETAKSIQVLPKYTQSYTRIRNISRTDDYNLKTLIPELELDDTFTFERPESLGVPVNTVTYDGYVKTDYIGTQTIYHRSFSTGVVTEYQLITDGQSGGGGVSVVGLTVTGLSASGLYVRGL